MINTYKLIPLSFLFLGIFILMQVMLPVISFQFWLVGQKYNNSLLISPMQGSGGGVLGISVQNKNNFPAFVSTLTRETKPNYDEFGLSIPALKIDNAGVKVDSNDLSNSLAHLPGSALPGEKGNIFISGHSALSQFFSLKNALFARLTDLKKGDRIIITAAGTKFLYQVVDLKVVDPNDLSVIPAPDELGRYVSLMTCVPPGLNFKRLVVIGEII